EFSGRQEVGERKLSGSILGSRSSGYTSSGSPADATAAKSAPAKGDGTPTGKKSGKKGARNNTGRQPQALALNLAEDGGGHFVPMVAAEQDKEKGGPLVRGTAERPTVANEEVTVEEPAGRVRRAHSMLSGPVVKILAGGALLAGILAVAGGRQET